MYWVIFAWPDSPSRFSSSSFGTAAVRSWITIEAVTYGMIPSAKIEKRASEAPQNRLSSPSTPAPRRLRIAEALTPGAGTHVPKR